MNKHSYTIEDKDWGHSAHSLDLPELMTYFLVYPIRTTTDIHVYYTESIDPNLPEDEIINAMAECDAWTFQLLRVIRKQISNHVLESKE